MRRATSRPGSQTETPGKQGRCWTDSAETQCRQTTLNSQEWLLEPPDLIKRMDAQCRGESVRSDSLPIQAVALRERWGRGQIAAVDRRRIEPVKRKQRVRLILVADPTAGFALTRTVRQVTAFVRAVRDDQPGQAVLRTFITRTVFAVGRL